MVGMLELSNEIFTLTCIDLTSTGEGVCDLDGYKIFVEGALPGEKISCQLIRKNKKYGVGKLVKIETPSELRVEPICPHFSECGGCQVMHLNYDGQLKIKKSRIEQVFRKIGNLEEVKVHDVCPSDPSLYYRNKIQMPVSSSDSGLKIGLYRKRSHDIIDVKRCFLHNKIGQKIYEEIRKILDQSELTYYNEKNRRGELRHLLIRSSRHQGKVLVMLIGTKKPSDEMRRVCKQIWELGEVGSVVHGINKKQSNFVFPDHTQVLHGPGYLVEEISGIQVQLSALSFFQVNITGAEAMYNKALLLGDIKEGTRVIDAYSGVGVFSTLLAKKGAVVTAIEVVKAAVADANRNAKSNRQKIDAICGKVEEVIPTCELADVIYLNPPRKGCEKSVLEAACKMNPLRMIYTSCDPSTLARDAKILHDLGYQKAEVFPFDLFAQTMHVESVALFTK